MADLPTFAQSQEQLRMIFKVGDQKILAEPANQPERTFRSDESLRAEGWRKEEIVCIPSTPEWDVE